MVLNGKLIELGETSYDEELVEISGSQMIMHHAMHITEKQDTKNKHHDEIVPFQLLFLNLIPNISVEYFRSPWILFKNFFLSANF